MSRSSRSDHRDDSVPARGPSASAGAAPTFAHALRNPLAYVISNLDYALSHLTAEASAPEDVRAALEEAREGAAQIAELLRDPLTAFRSAGR